MSRLLKAIHDQIDNLSDRTGNRVWPERLPHPDRPACHTLNIPGYRQLQSYTCGFAVTANVLAYFKPETDLEDLYEDLNSRLRTGITEFQITQSLRFRGIKILNRATLDWEGICEQLAKGYPVISTIRTRLGLHWVVVYGYDRERKTIFVCGLGTLPELNRKEIKFSNFTRRWEPCGNGLVCWCPDAEMETESASTTHRERTGRRPKTDDTLIG